MDREGALHPVGREREGHYTQWTEREALHLVDREEGTSFSGQKGETSPSGQRGGTSPSGQRGRHFTQWTERGAFHPVDRGWYFTQWTEGGNSPSGQKGVLHPVDI